MDKQQKQIEEVAKETSDKQWQRRDKYCLRIQKATQYKGDCDHEDIPSILVDYEEEIKKELIHENAVVLTREKYEKLTTPTIFIKTKSLSQKELDKKLKEMSNYGIIGVDESTIEIIPSRAEIEKETVEKFAEMFKEKLKELELGGWVEVETKCFNKIVDEMCKKFTEARNENYI